MEIKTHGLRPVRLLARTKTSVHVNITSVDRIEPYIPVASHCNGYE